MSTAETPGASGLAESGRKGHLGKSQKPSKEEKQRLKEEKKEREKEEKEAKKAAKKEKELEKKKEKKDKKEKKKDKKGRKEGDTIESLSASSPISVRAVDTGEAEDVPAVHRKKGIRRLTIFLSKRDDVKSPRGKTPRARTPREGTEAALLVQSAGSPRVVSGSPSDSASEASVDTRQSPKGILDAILAISTPVEKVFNFNEVQDEINGFRMLNIAHVEFVGKNLFLATLHDVLSLLPLSDNKEYARQCLFYSNDFPPEAILTEITEQFVAQLNGDRPKRAVFCTNCLRIVSAWLTTRGTTFTNNTLLLLVRDFVELAKEAAKTNDFLGEVVDELDTNLASVFTNQGVVRLMARRKMGPAGDAGPAAPPLDLLVPDCVELIPEQLAVVEWNFLQQLTPLDFYTYLTPESRTASPVQTFLYWRNLVSQWVVYEITRRDDIAERVRVLNAFFRLATHCLELKNFDSFHIVLTGINHQSVKRLSRTWAMLNEVQWKTYLDLNTVLNRVRQNNSSITVQPPCVPDFCLLSFLPAAELFRGSARRPPVAPNRAGRCGLPDVTDTKRSRLSG